MNIYYNPSSMRSIYKYIIYTLRILTSVLTISFAACSSSDDPQPTPADKSGVKTSILIYAVASNNLSSYLKEDMQEMREGAQALDLDKSEVYIYYLTKTELPALYRISDCDKSDATESDGLPVFDKVKEYDRSQFSTDPKRIRAVIEDYLELSSAAPSNRGIIFWSHSTAWEPAFSDHTVHEKRRSFGQDQYGTQSDQCDITELADAIPEDCFDFIWFDCCYMGNIEVAYQLRNKAKYMVGYPTEVWGTGMPYQNTLQYIAGSDPDLIKASDVFADYYVKQSLPVTIGVYSLTDIEPMVQIAASRIDADIPPRFLLTNYGRRGYQFYDFGEYYKSKGLPMDVKPTGRVAYDEAMKAFDDAVMRSALDKFVLHKRSNNMLFTSTGGTYTAVNPDYFSGVTTHHFVDEETERTDYYKSLDWYKAITNTKSYNNKTPSHKKC